MANNLELALRIRALVDGLKNVEALSQEVEELAEVAGVPFADPTVEVDQGARTAAGSLDTLRKQVLGLAAAIGAGAIAKEFLNTAASFETFAVQLETIEGSAEKAEQSLDWITTFASQTPYAVEEVTSAFTKLKAYGIDPTDGALKTLGDTAAAMGKPLEQGVEALADAMTGEYERLKEFGIKAKTVGDEVTFHYSHNGQEMAKTAKASSQEMIKSTLEAIWNERYAGGMDRFMGSWAGMTSNLGDLWTQFQREVMDAGVFDGLKAALGELIATINAASKSGELKAWAEQVGTAVAGLIDGIVSLTKFMAENATLVKYLVGTYAAYRVATSALTKGTLDFALALGRMSGVLATTTTATAGATAATAALSRAMKAVPVVALVGELAMLAAAYSDWRDAVDQQEQAEARAEKTRQRILAEAREGLTEYADQAKAAIAAADQVAMMGATQIGDYIKTLEGAIGYYRALRNEQLALGNDAGVREANAKLAEYRAALEAASEAAVALAGNSEEIADNIGPAVRGLIDQFNELRKGGESAEKALAAIAQPLDPAAVNSVRDIVGALAELERQGAATGTQIRDVLAAQIKGIASEELQNLTVAAEAAFGGMESHAATLAQINELVLGESFTRLGLTAETELGRISPAAQSAIASLDGIRATLIKAADEGAAKMAALGNAITASLARADTPAAVEQIRLRIEAMGKSGELAGEQLQRAMREVRARLDEVTPGINSVEDAFRQLGVTSQAELRKAAEAAREAYETIRGGSTTITDQQQAWLAWAKTAIESGDAAVIAMVQAEGSALGLSEQVARLAGQQQVVGDATRDAAASLRDQADSAGIAKVAMNDLADAAGAVADAQRSAASDGASFGAGMASVMNALRGEFAAFGDEALRALDGVVERSTLAGESVGGFFKRLAAGTERLRFEIEEEQRQAQVLLAQVQDTDRATAGMIDSAARAADSFKYLGDEQLEPLRAAIASARAELEALQEAATRTMESLQDDLDRMDGNEEALAKRRAERRREEIETQLDVAKAYGDNESIIALQESLRLADELEAREREKARLAEQERKAREAERQEEARQPSQPTRTTTPATTPAREPVQPMRTVRVELAMGTRVTPIDVLPGQEADLEAFFRQLETARGTAQ